MKFTVVWRPIALNRLAELWTKSADRGAVARASDAIDALLADDPHSQGESRSGAIRILIVIPLGVLFKISDPDCLVTVLKVWEMV
jgi:hypothetical protein